MHARKNCKLSETERDRRTCSPSRGARVVCEQEKPYRSEPAISFLISVPLPTPEGPHMTRALGSVSALASAASGPPLAAWGAVSEENVLPIPQACVRRQELQLSG